MDQPDEQVLLTFREQADGRKVSRLPSGKVVLVDLDQRKLVKDGERWLVRIEHHDLYCVAYPIDRVAPVGSPTLQVPTAKPAPVPTKAPEPPKYLPPANRAKPSMFLRPQDRVAIFVDGANMDGACRDAGYFLDYYKVGSFLRANATFNAAFFYIADFTAKDPVQLKFLDFLAHSGYIVRKKAVKVIKDRETGKEIYKANVDTEMVLDMVNTADNYDVAFLLSGDSDFERCVDLLRSRGKRVFVMSSEGSMSRELSHVADKPIFFIEDYQDLLIREPTPSNP